MTAKEAAQAVKARAADLGFDACGVAAAGLVDPEDRLGAWLARGFHAGMRWMERNPALRQDIRLRLPGARSVVVVARNYYAERPPHGPEAGRVARYAWGRDYHRVLRAPLRALAGTISSLAPGARCYCCVDTGPVLERAWAARAGIGWIGKNSLAIRPGLGSWFFLGVIATTAELASDAPAQERCGACTRCMDACPTGAIVEPRVVDAGRCIAYHTIENRGAIPETVQARMGRWVFGCDICQEVCPWNQASRTTTEPEFLPREGQAAPDLDELLRLDDEGFQQRFGDTAIRRAALAGIQRNARAAQQNPIAPNVDRA